MSGIPSGLVTFVFTDVEGSTRLWDTVPEDMQVALARHDALVADAVQAHEGHVFSTGGDGYGISFHTTQQAVDAVARIQSALAAEPWPERAEIRIRIGVHVGLSEERNGDYFGTAVNRAARLMSAGHGGQTLLSSAAIEAVPGTDAIDLGIHRLKDLSAPEHIFQLVVPDLPGSFAPLRTLDETKTSLPVRPVNLVGREGDLLQLGDLLRTHSLVTLCGPGGVGKTTLAIRAAAQASGQADGGVWLVELAPVLDADGVPFAFLDGMRAPTKGGDDPVRSVIEAIGDRTTFLVVDNCEHLREDVARVIRSILDECPDVTILATSREPLGITAEASLPIEPLRTDGDDSPSVRLFIDRAKDANPHLELDPPTVVAITELCQSLDGLPLAIELAAARSRSFTPADLRSRLDQRFRVLQGRGTDDRHATLRGTIEWSHQLLEADERILFERLSVFAGEFDLAAVEAVCTDEIVDALDVFDIIDRLVQRSMVVAEVHGPKARFHLLQSLRDFAADELREPDVWRRRHAEEYGAAVRRIVADLYGPRESEVLADLEAMWDDVRVAVAFAREAGDVVLLEQLISGLGVETMFRARTEVAEWAKAALALTGRPSPALQAMGVVAASVTGDLEAVASIGADYAQVAPSDGEFSSMDAIGVALASHLAGEPDRAELLYELALERAPFTARAEVQAWVDPLKGLLYIYTSRPDEAAEVLAAAGRVLSEHPMGPTVQIGYDLIDTLQMVDPPNVVVERMQGVSRAATAVRSRLIRDVADMNVAVGLSQLGDASSALLEAADLLAQLSQRASFTNVSQQLRRSAVMLLGADAHETGVLLLEYLIHHRAPAPNPATAAELANLEPAARAALTDAAQESLTERARTISHAAVIDEAVAAMRDAARRAAEAMPDPGAESAAP
ncbi:MAG: adenylate/guanylate cyclase domain-containing protein [Actinomycetota bacterium]